MVTIEAMSMGCVPIGYDVPSGTTEIIEHERNGLLVGLGDIDALAATIERLASRRDLLLRMGDAAIVRARGSFNASMMAERMAEAVTSVVDSARVICSERRDGIPPLGEAQAAMRPRGYQRVPACVRAWLRRQMGIRPYLSYWLQNR